MNGLEKIYKKSRPQFILEKWQQRGGWRGRRQQWQKGQKQQQQNGSGKNAMVETVWGASIRRSFMICIWINCCRQLAGESATISPFSIWTVSCNVILLLPSTRDIHLNIALFHFSHYSFQCIPCTKAPEREYNTYPQQWISSNTITSVHRKDSRGSDNNYEYECGGCERIYRRMVLLLCVFVWNQNPTGQRMNVQCNETVTQYGKSFSLQTVKFHFEGFPA